MAQIIGNNTPDGFPQHFEIQLDKVNTFDGGDLTIFRSYPDQTGWEFFDGEDWLPLPASGLPVEYGGNQVRYAVQAGLTVGTWYRRVRGRILRY